MTKKRDEVPNETSSSDFPLHHRENFKNRTGQDPEAKCFLPGVPRAMYLPQPFQILQSTDHIMLKVTERIRARSPDTLNYEATIDDPKVFTRTWKITLPLYRRVERNAQIMEFKCVEFAEELMYGHLRKQPASK